MTSARRCWRARPRRSPRSRARATAAPTATATTPLGPGYALLDAIFWFVAGLAERQPLLLAVDDLHWVDDASLRALDYLARRLAELPVALIAALRPAEPGASASLLDALRQRPRPSGSCCVR